MKKLRLLCLPVALSLIVGVATMFSTVLVPSVAQAAATTCKSDVNSKTDAAGRDPAIGCGRCSSVDNCELITTYINPLVNFMAALVGVAVVASIIYGGIQYGSSGGDPQKSTAGKLRIRNALIALLAFFFLYALLNFLIPGGLL